MIGNEYVKFMWFVKDVIYLNEGLLEKCYMVFFV